MNPPAITGHQLRAALARARVRQRHYLTTSAIRKGATEEVAHAASRVARLRELRARYDLEVHVRCEEAQVPLARVRVLAREARRTWLGFASKLAPGSDDVEVALVAGLRARAATLQGVVAEGLGVRTALEGLDDREAGALGLV